MSIEVDFAPEGAGKELRRTLPVETRSIAADKISYVYVQSIFLAELT